MEGTLGLIIFFIWFFFWAFYIQENVWMYDEQRQKKVLVMRWEGWANNLGIKRDSFLAMLFMFFIYPAGWYFGTWVLFSLGLIWLD